MTSDAQAVQFDERRNASRADIGGRYTMRLDPCDGGDTITCAVMDYSVAGARLELPQDVSPPSDHWSSASSAHFRTASG